MPAYASGGLCDGLACLVRGGGAAVGGTVSSDDVVKPDTGAAREDVISTGRRRSESTLTPGCPGNDPNIDRSYDVACYMLVRSCQDGGLGPGPLTWIWSRALNVDGSPAGRWVRTGQSCNVPAAVVAAASPRPALTIGVIRQAFRQVDFAKPTAHIQPEGNVTLVNLPTYYQVRWPAQGVEPAEIATVRLLGRSVRIRPLSRSFTYRFGDGHSAGPTTDPGGPYPDGGIQHTYLRAARVAVSVHATYSGEFSVDGGPWQQVGDTVQIPGPATGLRVREAHARLEAN